jgi:hypothetical protein
VVVSIAVASVGVLSLCVTQLRVSAAREHRAALAQLQSQYSAEAAISAALVSLQNGGDGNVFTGDAPLVLLGAAATVEVTDLGDGLYDVIGRGAEGAARFGAEVVAAQVNNSLFQYGAFGDEWLHLDSNAQVDSYNSSDGAYAATNGTGSSAHSGEGGTIGSNGDVLLEQNVKVWGDVVNGPSGTTAVLGNAQLSGTASTAPAPTPLPPITLPAVAQTNPYSVGNGGNATLASGTAGFTSMVVGTNATLTVTGPASLVLNSLRLRSGSKLRIDDSGGPVSIYVVGDFLIDSNSQVHSLDYEPADVSFLLLSDNIFDPDQDVDVDADAEVDFDSNSKIYGTIYAPSAKIEIDSNFELFGAVIAQQLDLDSNCKIHYDESLADSDLLATPSWELTGWRISGYHP